MGEPDSEDEAAPGPGERRTGVSVAAEGFGLDGPRGTVFRDITFTAEPGSLVAITGPSGSGRTCLLLALTGRMKSTAGSARAGRARLPKQKAAVRRISALGPVPGITDLDPALSVAEHLRERSLLQRRFGGSLRALLRPRKERAAAGRARLDAALAAAGLDLDALPKGPRTRVRDLERLECLRLSLALALLGEPRLVAVDDADLKLSPDEREQAWDLLRSIARAGTTVLAVCGEAPGDAVVVRTGQAAERPAPAGRDRAPDTSGGSPDGTGRDAEGTGRAAGDAGRAADGGTEDAGTAEHARPSEGTADTDTRQTEEGGTADALAETGRA